MKYKKIDSEVEVERFFPQVKPWPEGLEEYTKELSESVSGEKSKWFGWRIMTADGWTEVRPHDYILYETDGTKKVLDRETLFRFYKPA